MKSQKYNIFQIENHYIIAQDYATAEILFREIFKRSPKSIDLIAGIRHDSNSLLISQDLEK